MEEIPKDKRDKMLDTFAKEIVVPAYESAVGGVESVLKNPLNTDKENLRRELAKLDNEEDRYILIAKLAAETALSYFFGGLDLVPDVVKIYLQDKEGKEHALEDVLIAPFAVIMLPEDDWIGKFSKYEHVSDKIYKIPS